MLDGWKTKTGGKRRRTFCSLCVLQLFSRAGSTGIIVKERREFAAGGSISFSSLPGCMLFTSGQGM